jgi:hypothetical protein
MHGDEDESDEEKGIIIFDISYYITFKGGKNSLKLK